MLQEFESEQERKRLELKKRKAKEILSLIKYDFLPLKNIPFGLNLGGIYQNCKFCNCSLHLRNYYISYKAIKHTHFICIDCLRVKDSLGRGQPSNKYGNAIKYIVSFDNNLEIFIKKFLNYNDSSEIIFSREELTMLFIENIIQ